jgi:hypothetical protein
MVKGVCTVYTTVGTVGAMKVTDCKLNNRSDRAVGIRITDH